MANWYVGISQTVSRQAVRLPRLTDCESRGSDHDQREEGGADDADADAGFPFSSGQHLHLDSNKSCSEMKMQVQKERQICERRMHQGVMRVRSIEENEADLKE
jgi:hypothetical protein